MWTRINGEVFRFVKSLCNTYLFLLLRAFIWKCQITKYSKIHFLFKTSYTSVCSKTFLNLTNNAERGNKYFEETEWRNAGKQEKVLIMSVNSFLVIIVNYCSLLDFFEKQRSKFEEITSAKIYKTVGLLFCLHAKTTHVDYLNWVILNHAARALYGSW